MNQRNTGFNIDEELSNCGNKIIHYCWFGGKPLSKMAKKCIKSWKKYLPDYTIVQWNENNFDVRINAFSSKAYDMKKWAFVADVARCYVLKKYGGLYFDTDMMVTADISHVLEGSFAAGWESDYNVAAGIIWVREPENLILQRLWDFYENNSFDIDNVFAFSIPTLLTRILQQDYCLRFFVPEIQRLRDDTLIFPRDYFYPINSDGSGNDWYSDNTCMVHYYLGSWLPRSEKLRAEFKVKFGPKLGNLLLNILVYGKRALRLIAKIIFRPYILRKRKMERRAFEEEYISAFDKAAALLHSPDYIAICNKNWYGTSIATKELFDNVICLDELHSDVLVEHIANYIATSGVHLIIFSAFSIGWDKLIKRIKELKPDIVVKVLWHGSLALNSESYDWEMFCTILTLHNTGLVQSLGFVKKSVYEFFLRKGYRAEFIANRVELPAELVSSIPRVGEHKHIKIGLYASGDRWVKNSYNQLAAASLFENAEINCIPLSHKTVIMSRFFNFSLSGSYANVPREKLLATLAGNDINFYATFTECAPMLPLESLELGVPCITGKNHHYWQGTELEKYLVVDRVDDCIEIYNKAIFCLENKEEVLRLYNQWREANRAESIESVNRFLSL